MNRSLYISSTSAIGLLLFIIYPLASLPFILYGIYKRETVSYILFICFAGIIGLLIPAFGDLYRYYLVYESFVNGKLSDIVFSTEADYILSVICYACAKLKIHPDYVRFIYNVAGYSLMMSLYTNVYQNNDYLRQNKHASFMLFLCLWFALGWLSQLYRWGLSVTMLAYGLYFAEKGQLRKGWFWLIMSALNHVIIWFVLIFVVIQSFKRFNFNKIVLTIFLVFILFASIDVMGSIIDRVFSGNLLHRLSAYTSGYWGNAYREGASAKKNIQYLLTDISLFPFYILVIYFQRKGKFLQSPVHMIYFILFIFCGFSNIFGRMSSIFLLLTILFFFSNYTNTYKNKLWTNVILVSLFIRFSMSIWVMHRAFEFGHLSMITNSSLFNILTTPYDESWIWMNIDSSGDFIHEHLQ